VQPEAALDSTAVANLTHRRIQASHGLVPIDFGELWRYRELLGYFLWRDIKARYRQTFLGAFWAIFRPFVSMVLFSVIFGGLAGIKSGSGIPYPLFVYTPMFAWSYFQSALTSSASSLLNVGGLMSKAYFPRLYGPISSALAPLVDFFLSMSVLFILFAWYHRAPSWHIVFLPLFLLLAALVGMGVGLWLSGITVRYRDVAFALPFAVQVWLYVTPVIYPVTLVPEKYRWLISLNPVTAVIDGFRWAVLGMAFPRPLELGLSIAFAVLAVTCGLFFFRRTERTIVDMI